MKISLNKKIIILGAVVLLLLVGLVGTTLAWLTDTKEANINFVMGDVNYECSFNIADNQVVVPGQPLINDGEIKIVNKSTVPTNVRVKILVTEKDQTDELNDIVTISFLGNSNWVKDDTDGYWYYKGKPTDLTDRSADVSVASDKTNGDELIFNANISFDGAKVGNSYSGKTYTIKVIIEGKQAEYVLWENMANIDFSTGLSK